MTDRAMKLIGLPGKAFIPLIVGFGCNVPAISATRVLASPYQRIQTALLVPFTSCTARLTVYVMLASTFFPKHAGNVVFLMYVISIALVVGIGFLMKRPVAEDGQRSAGHRLAYLPIPRRALGAFRGLGSVEGLPENRRWDHRGHRHRGVCPPGHTRARRCGLR